MKLDITGNQDIHIANAFTYKVESIYHYLNNEERSCNHNCLFPLYLIVISVFENMYNSFWMRLTDYTRHSMVKKKSHYDLVRSMNLNED